MLGFTDMLCPQDRCLIIPTCPAASTYFLATDTSIPYRRGMASKALLPEQDALLCELVEEYEKLGDRPQVRVGPQGRTGSRVWLWGERHVELAGKRKLEDFAELGHHATCLSSAGVDEVARRERKWTLDATTSVT